MEKIKKEKKYTNIASAHIIKKLATEMEGCYLTIDQMTDAIDFFTCYIARYLKSSVCPENVKITVPNLGKISFKKKKGLKAGTKYCTTADFGKTRDENGNPIMTVGLLEEDKPDYLRVWFEISPTLQKEVREATEKRLG